VIRRGTIPRAPEGRSSETVEAPTRGDDEAGADWGDDETGAEGGRSGRAVARSRPAVAAYAPHGVLVNAISQIVKEFSEHAVGRFVVTVRVQVGYNTTEVSVSSDDVQRTAVTG
jgi:hypothetical protein